MRSEPLFVLPLIGRAMLSLAVVLFCAPLLLARPKIDVVVMNNGDRLTCEIIKLENGQLQVKSANSTGTVSLDWLKVDSIESVQYFVIETADGRTMAGPIRKVAAGGSHGPEFQIGPEAASSVVAMAEVVAIGRSGERLFARLSGTVSSGYTYTKGNNGTQFNLSGNLDLRGRANEVLTTFQSTVTSQNNGTSDYYDLNTMYVRLLRRNWFLGGYNDFLRSGEQELDLRATLGVLAGRRVVRTNRTVLSVAAGTVYSRENYRAEVSGTNQSNNAEAIIGIQCMLFRFDSTQFQFASRSFPSLTTPGRIRVETNLSAKIDMTHKLFWNTSFYSNYDSHPPVKATSTDFGVSTGLGYTF